MNDLDTDKLAYWDDDKQQFYWIQWEDRGTYDHAFRHYIDYPTTDKLNKYKSCKGCHFQTNDKIICRHCAHAASGDYYTTEDS